ncbi:MAG TPA: MBL fold metallo-hydrolase [Solirubrobacteraceae bacterium]
MSDEAEEREQAEQALAQAAAAGIHRLPIPTPFRVGRVNAYLIEDDPLTLIDSGPNSAKSLDELERGLAALGHSIEELGLLVITHQHIDHFGLASILARRSAAEVAALAPLAPYLDDFNHQTEADDAFAEAMMLRHGVPEQVAQALRAVAASFRGWGADVHVTQPLAADGLLSLRDRQLRVLHHPGHSPSDTLFYDERRGTLFAGDHLIKHISSNPLISRPLQAGGQASSIDPRPHALLTYIDSMKRTQAMDLKLVLPGHGVPITDHASLIDERLRMHERRAQKIARLIEQRPRTAHEIAQEIWGNIAVTQAYLTLSEVLGHVDLLLQANRIVEVEEDGVVHFHPAS